MSRHMKGRRAAQMRQLEKRATWARHFGESVRTSPISSTAGKSAAKSTDRKE